MSSESETTEETRPWRRMSPEQTRNARFGRSPLTRRGLDENEVYGFTHRLAQELGDRESEITKLVDENRRLKQAMRDWHSQHRDRGQGELRSGAPEALDSANADAAALMARAQQQIDAQVAQAELYCRQREEEAIQRYDEIVQQARQQAKLDAERVAHQYRAAAGGGYSSDREQVRRQQVYLTALLHALDALANHVHATRNAFAVEVQKLGGSPAAGGATDGGATAGSGRATDSGSEGQPRRSDRRDRAAAGGRGPEHGDDSPWS